MLPDKISVRPGHQERPMPKKILIVDDEPYVRTLLKRTLEDLEDDGVELLIAYDGRQGLELALAERPDLILLDVMMPYFNGYEVCERVKAEYKDIYIILLTAKGQAADRFKGAEAGADQYVTKPFNPDYILEQALQILKMEV